VGPKKSLLAATGFTRQAVGIRLSCGSLTSAVGATSWSWQRSAYRAERQRLCLARAVAPV